MGEIPQAEADAMEWQDVPDESSEPDYEDMEQRAQETREELAAAEAADADTDGDPELLFSQWDDADEWNYTEQTEEDTPSDPDEDPSTDSGEAWSYAGWPWEG